MLGFVYDVYLLILFNYQDIYNSVLIYVYEWGYVMYQVLINENQLYEFFGFFIFIIEIVVIVQELMFQEYMLEQVQFEEECFFYFGYVLEQMCGMYFCQVMFLEFELVIYEVVEWGEVLIGVCMIEMYGEIFCWYYGYDEGVLEIIECEMIEWVYILYFYFNFYVYQYVIFIVGVVYFVDQIGFGGDVVCEIYFDFLKVGGFDYLVEILCDVGFDMMIMDFYNVVIDCMDVVMDEIEVIFDVCE